jgi:hypothetical protein
LALFLTILIGILSRVFHTGFLVFDKYLGDSLYAVMFYLLLSIVWDRGKPSRKAFITTVLMMAIELFQLTLIPLHFRSSDSSVLKAVSIVLGTKFGWFDIVAYLAGILIVYIFDRFYLCRISSKIKRSFCYGRFWFIFYTKSKLIV